ncbi:HXXEE domain-containing protein [Pseudofrancisella aestuarii]|uniref:HXXEE domain-containing protein n=1 Tax=Pseudofrancisella aestuarii TaxID=2670347 RepID=A0ABV9T9B7_9GAMM|nr:HXXEE domain-containing protein [Pseudofrancisella aestuarii]
MMIYFLAKNQNWAKAAPWLGIVSLFLLFLNFSVSDPHLWALINIPLYFFHQTEEHYIPGGFKSFMNEKVLKSIDGKETLTDVKIFWINIIMVWLAFAIFGTLSFINLGFGLLIIIFSIMNCLTHIHEGIKLKAWNPGLVMASIQFVISIFAAIYVSMHGLDNVLAWWIGTIIFSILAHVLLFKLVMSK